MFANFLIGHQRVFQAGQCEIVSFRHEIFVAVEQAIGEAFRHHRAAGMI